MTDFVQRSVNNPAFQTKTLWAFMGKNHLSSISADDPEEFQTFGGIEKKSLQNLYKTSKAPAVHL